MKKIALTAMTLAAFTCACWSLGRKYSYVDHNVYVYKFINDTTVTFMDRHDTKYQCAVDSAECGEMKSQRGAWYVLRHYDTGEAEIIGAAEL